MFGGWTKNAGLDMPGVYDWKINKECRTRKAWSEWSVDGQRIED